MEFRPSKPLNLVTLLVKIVFDSGLVDRDPMAMIREVS